MVSEAAGSEVGVVESCHGWIDLLARWWRMALCLTNDGLFNGVACKLQGALRAGERSIEGEA